MCSVAPFARRPLPAIARTMREPADADSPHLADLNPAQREAATAGVAAAGPLVAGPPLLIIAGAGTGKTTTLAHRVAHLILKGADPGRILLLTFTRRAARTMVKRAEEIAARTLGRDAALAGRLDWAGTFHAMGARLLRLYAPLIGLDPGFTILDRADAMDLLDLVRDELGLARSDRRFPKKATCLAVYSYAVNAGLPLEEAVPASHPWCAAWIDDLKRLFQGYVEAKQRQGLLDYDDLLLWWATMMEVESLARDAAKRFDFVLVDEYQDTNAIQARLLERLKPDGRGLTVVGDDAQAIYGFRAATVRNILDFPDRFDPPAGIVRLEDNYRSTQPLLDAANALIRGAAERHEKELRAARQRPAAAPARLVHVRDDLAQAEYAATTILANREAGMALMEQAVLFRAAAHSAALELELARRQIPYVKYGGLRFLEAAHIKDVMAVLRWAENPRDRPAAYRVLKLLPGIGPATARRALDALEAAPAGFAGLENFRPPAATREVWPQLLGLLRELRTLAWADQVRRLRQTLYDAILETVYDFPQARRADLDQLEALAAASPSRERFLTELALDPPEVTGGPSGAPTRDEDYLILSTIHSAKGQEWKAVFVLNMVDGCIPSDMATGSAATIEEERRLAYVAMTRARDALHLLQPERFHVTGQARHGDRSVRATRSRFISEAVLGHLEVRTFPDAGDDPAGRRATAPTPPLTPVDIATGLKSMWQ